MRHSHILVVLLALLCIHAVAQDSSTLPTEKDKFSYALGMQVGEGFRKQSLDLNAETVAKGIIDAYTGGKTVLTEAEMRDVLSHAQKEFEKKTTELREQQGQEQLKYGQEFLAANQRKPGVVALPSGLQYRILKQGKGKKPDLDSFVVCNYRSMRIDGTEFDNSSKHSGPVTLSVRGTIKGWQEALQLMPAGSKWELYIPYYLAYGSLGAGQFVPPNATLVFELELVKIKKDRLEQEHERE